MLLNPNRLRYYGITPQQVVTAITSSALNLPIGTIVKNNTALTFSTQNTPENLDQIGQTLVDSTRGISVDDLGSVRGTPSATNFVRVNGMPQVLVSIQRTTDSNSIAVANSVRALMAKTSMPRGYTLTYSNDTTTAVKASVEATYHELFVTGLVVALIVLLFLGKLNTAISVILAIPIALSAAPVLYGLAGFTFNLVSLLALITAIGIVVDDSIVVAENVERYRAMGYSLKESVLRGASEVFSAVVAASLSLLSVLLPVSFIPGFIGSYLRQFSLGLAAAVTFSLLEAVLFLTVRLAFTPESKDGDWGDFFKSWTKAGASLQVGIHRLAEASGHPCRDCRSRRPAGDPAFPVPARHDRLPDRTRHRFLCLPHRLLTAPGPHHDPSRLDRGSAGVGARRLHAHPRGRAAEWGLGSRRVRPVPPGDRVPGRAPAPVQLRAADGRGDPPGEPPLSGWYTEYRYERRGRQGSKASCSSSPKSRRCRPSWELPTRESAGSSPQGTPRQS